MEVGEDDFVGEQRGPFKGGSAVGVGTADEFMLAVGELNEFGPSKLLDQLLAAALRNQIF